MNDVTLSVDKEICMKANYRIVAATDEQIMDIVCKYNKIPDGARKPMETPMQDNQWWVKDWLYIVKNLPELLVGLQVSEYHNLVPTVLRYSLATLISGTTVTPTFKANYFALGTSSTAVANSDTQLGTETLRGAFTARSSYQNVAYLDVFFPSTSVGGNTYNEAGIFVDGSASVNTGYLLSHVAINQTLGSSQTLTVNCSITIS